MAHVQSGDALGASYRLEEPIGSGAVGEVWRVSSASGGPDLAAKLLRPEHAQDPTLVERFVRERSVLLALRHPNIVAVRDLVVEGDRLAIVMDFVPGGSVRDLLESRLTLPAGEALALCAEVLDALASAHAGSTTHRDIKPDNVLLAEPWRPGPPGRGEGLRLRDRLRHRGTDPAHHGNGGHPAVHAARAAQPGRDRARGGHLCHGHHAVRADRGTDAVCRTPAPTSRWPTAT